MTQQEPRIAVQVMQYDETSVAYWDGNLTGGVPPDSGERARPNIPRYADNGSLWAWWGDDDLFPTMLREKIEQVPIAGATIARKIKMMAGNGLIYYKKEDLFRSPKTAEPVMLQEVEDFLEENRILTHWLPGQMGDFCIPFNSFSQMVRNVGRDKITNIYHMSAEHCRLSKPTPETMNVSDRLFYSYHFPYGHGQAKENRIELPLYLWWQQGWLDNFQGDTFAWHTAMPTPGMVHYARPWWIGLFKPGGWLDVSGQVSKIVSAMQRNQVSLKYIIYLPESYFRSIHAEWDNMLLDERRNIVQRKVDEINRHLTGTEAAHKSISNFVRENEVTGEMIGKIEIVAIDDKTKAGAWVPDSYAADAQIVQGFEMHPSQIGLAPEGGKMGAGSGADMREGYNLGITLNTPDQRLVLEPLNFISKVNNWGVTFMCDHTTHTTTNNKESGFNQSQSVTGLPND